MWLKLWRQPGSRLGISIVVFFLAVAVLAPIIVSESSAITGNVEEVLLAPSAKHLLGTDSDGKDVFAQIIWGTRLSLTVGLVSAFIAIFLGTILGALAGYFRGTVDAVILRFIESFMCFPALFIILAALAFVGPSPAAVIAILGLTSWPGAARLVRGEMLKLHPRLHVVAAKATGARSFWVIWHHMLPFAIPPVLVTLSFTVAAAILTEAALSYLGFGAPPDVPSWGRLLAQGQMYADFAWWLTIPAGIVIFTLVFAYNRMGEALRNLIEPGAK